MSEENTRLDSYITKNFPGFSRGSASRLIKEGKALVNKVSETKPSYHVKPEDKVKIIDSREKHKIKKIKLPVLYEDDDCVVINKPAGILSHSKGNYNYEATVATWLEDKTTGLEGNRAGIVHRLDRATSGVMICAKNQEALHWLQKQFSLRRTIKSYIAIAPGHFDKPKAIIELPIERNPKKPQTFRVGANGKSAITEYEVTNVKDGLSQLLLKPKTGRTHQLRVHLAFLGHPILGDMLYGGKTADRLYLHSRKLELTLPSHERKVFEAPLPKEFKVYFK